MPPNQHRESDNYTLKVAVVKGKCFTSKERIGRNELLSAGKKPMGELTTSK